MWIKHNKVLINLDKVQAIWCGKRSTGRCSLVFEYVGDDNEQWVDFQSEEEMLQAFEVIVCALGQTEVCDLDGK